MSFWLAAAAATVSALPVLGLGMYGATKLAEWGLRLSYRWGAAFWMGFGFSVGLPAFAGAIGLAGLVWVSVFRWLA